MAPETELQLTVLVVQRIIEVFHKKLPAIIGSPYLIATARAAFHRLSGAPAVVQPGTWSFLL